MKGGLTKNDRMDAMISNEKLAIAIPTYNRPFILKENLLTMLPDLEKFHIAVFISDDSDNDDTKQMVAQFKLHYQNIHYYKNDPSLGHDLNCLATLGKPCEQYIWYLSDAQIIAHGVLERVSYEIDKNKYDFIVVNSENRKVTIETKVYTDPNAFFVDLAWHATMTGATIYRKEVLFRHDYGKYTQSNFMQLGVLLEELTESENGVLWINENMIIGNRNKRESYWRKSVFKVFALDWSEFIFILPKVYTGANKREVIRSHSNNTGLFKFRSYLLLRSENILNLKSYLKYFGALKQATSMNIYTVPFLFLLPPRVLMLLRRRLKSISK